jgi:uncharacterized membrane protein YdjX (TVP38/TMEM64 family)
MKDTYKNIIIVAIVVAIMGGVSFFVPIEEARDIVLSAGIWGPIILIALKASTIIFAPLSGSPLYPVAGAIFGPWYGLMYILIGDLIGSAVSFGISRRYGRIILGKFLDKAHHPYVDAVLSYMGTTKGFVIARILFSPMPELVSYAAGLTRIRWVPFLIIHNTIGLIPSLILVVFGATVVEVSGPLAVIGVILAGSLAVAIGGYIFLRQIRPRLAKKAEEVETPR